MKEDRDGESSVVFSWGLGTSYQLGQNNTNNRTQPTIVVIPFDATQAASPNPIPSTQSRDEYDPIVQVSCSYNSSFARTRGGKLYGWGANSNGEMGMGDTANKMIPTLITYFGDHQLKVRHIVGHGNSYMVSCLCVDESDYDDETKEKEKEEKKGKSEKKTKRGEKK